MPAGANLTIAFAQFGRIFAALGAGRHSDAYQAAERLLDPASPAHPRIVACGRHTDTEALDAALLDRAAVGVLHDVRAIP